MGAWAFYSSDKPEILQNKHRKTVGVLSMCALSPKKEQFPWSLKIFVYPLGDGLYNGTIISIFLFCFVLFHWY